jgi:hypothetical protein
MKWDMFCSSAKFDSRSNNGLLTHRDRHIGNITNSYNYQNYTIACW